MLCVNALRLFYKNLFGASMFLKKERNFQIYHFLGISLRDSLKKNVTKLAENTQVDYHPNSNDIVRDLVHPALYPYVEGVSKVST